MDMKELIERTDREAAARAALLASLPQDVQAALQRLPEEGRRQLLMYVRDLKAHSDRRDHSQDIERILISGMFLGVISYASALGQLDRASYQRLFDFEQTLTGAPA